MSWSQVSFGFNVEEETKNFGTRAVGLGQEAIFESTTVAVIKSQDVNDNVKPWSLFKSIDTKGFLVVLNGSLNVFGPTFSELLMSFDFASLIEEVEWSKDGSFIFIGLQGGTLVALHVPTQTLFKLSSGLDASGVYDDKHFFAKIKSFCNGTDIELIVVTSLREIIRIHGSCVKNLVELCSSQVERTEKRNALSSVTSSLKFEILSSPIFCSSEAKVAETSSSDSLIIVHNNVIEHWIMDGGLLNLVNSGPLEEIAEIVSAHYLYSSDRPCVIFQLVSGALLFTDVDTLEPCFLWEELFVKDLSLIYSGQAESKMLLLVKNEASSFDLYAYTYPEFSLYFKLPNLFEGVLPVELHDCFHYLEFIGDEVIETVKIKTIMESDQKLRLERLLARGKFDEAEEFCHFFNLSKVEIYKCKAKKLADEISLWKQGFINITSAEESINARPSQDLSILFQSLISILDDIQDVEFVVDLCTLSVPCQLDFVDKLLQYALSRLDKIHQKEAGNVVYVEKVVDLIKLFRIFTALHGIEHSPDSWASFPSSDFFKDIQNYIRKGEVKDAVVLCEGCWDKISQGLSSEGAIALLELLPYHLPLSDLLLWLSSYVPLYLSLHQDSFRFFNKWIVHTIYVIGCINDDIELCHNLMDHLYGILMKTSNQSLCLPHSIPSLADYLMETLRILKKLIYLKQHHAVKVPFKKIPTSHSKEEKVDFILSILESVISDDIEVFVKHFIKPYCSEHSLRCDEILLQHLTMSKAGGFEKIWDSRRIKLTEFIYNLSDKMKAILCVLKNASVPWSDTISEFANYWYKNSNESNKIEIDNIKKVATVQGIILKYGITPSELNNICYDNMDNIISYIIDESSFVDQTDLLDDVRTLLKTTNGKSMLQLYSHFLCTSVSSGCTKEAIEMVEEELTLNQAVDFEKLYEICARELLNLCTNLWIYHPDYKQNNLEVLFAKIIYRLPATNLPVDFMDVVQELKINYDVNIHLHDMRHSESKSEVIFQCTEKLLLVDDTAIEEKDINKNCTVAVRDLSVKLDVPYWIGCLDLASKALDTGKLDVVVDCINDLIAENSRGTIPADKLYNFVFKMLHVEGIHRNSAMLDCVSFLVKTVSLEAISTVARDVEFFNKMSACNLMLDLMRGGKTGHFNKPVWYTDSLFVDTVSYQPNFSQAQITLLLSLLSGNLISNEIENFDIKGFIMELLTFLPNSLQGVDIALRTLNTAKYLYPLEFKDVTMPDDIGNHIMKMVSDTLLRSVYSNSFDVNVALGLLMYFPQESALRWIDNVSFKTDKFRLHNLAHLALKYGALYKIDNSQLADYSQINKISIWEKQFKQYGISFENIYGDESIKSSIIQSLIKVPGFNCNLLKLFCDTFECSYECHLITYLTNILIHWKLDYSIEDDELVIKSEAEDLYNTCRNITNECPLSQIQLANIITKTIWDKINPYYYEVHSVIINLLKYLGQDDSEDLVKKEILLNFLLSYKRFGALGNNERQMWDHYDGQQLAQLQNLSKFRLPFIQLLPDQVTNIISAELNLDNYKQWLQLPSWMNRQLSPEVICMVTIKNLRREIPDGQEVWELQLKSQDFLSKIIECCSKIENPYAAWSSLYWAVNNTLPPGADQVEAAQHCLFKAFEWCDREDNSKSRAACKKAEMKYSSLRIMHILHKHNLAKPELLNLSTKPVELLRALYSDASVAGHSSNSGINIAASTIASVSKITSELTDIKKELLMEWLTHSSFQQDDNLDFKMENTKYHQDLARIVYMLKDEDEQLFNSILVQSILVQDDNAKPVQMKLRALQILLSIMPHNRLHALTGKTTEQLMDCLKTYQFVFDLEQVGLSYPVTEFESMPKDTLISYLLRNPTKRNCVIAADIAVAYNLKAANIWNKILPVFSVNNMGHQLEKHLVKISKWSRSVLDTNILVNAWNTVIKLKCHIVEVHVRSKHMELSTFLLDCPVLDLIDLSYIDNNIRKQINFLKKTT